MQFLEWLYTKRKKKHIEHEGDLTVFREAMMLAEARRRGEESGVRPVILILAGILRGVYGGGGVRALNKAGLTQGFSAGVGVSTGAPTLAYFLAKQSGVGTSMYYEDALSDNFISLFGKHIVNISYLAQIWRGQVGAKKLDTVALQDNPTRAYVSAIPVDGASSLFLSLKDERDPVECLVAACTMPGLYDGDATIGGVEMYDGAFAESLPIEACVEAESPTSVLIFMNRPRDSKDDSWWTWGYDMYVWYVVGLRTHIAAHEKDRRREKALNYLRTSGIPYCIVYTDEEVQPFTMDAESMMSAADRFEAYVTGLLRKVKEK